MFGFQRTGDQIVGAATPMARGFVLARPRGRTTLDGEGLSTKTATATLAAMSVRTSSLTT